MIADGLLGWLFDGVIATSAAMLLVLALRHPLRRAFGARIAYMAWALVPLALAAVSLPAPRSTTALLQALPGLRAAVIVGAATPLQATGAAAAMPALDWMLLFATGWCIGAILLALRFRRQQQKFVAGLGQLQPRDDGTYIADAGQCPVVIGAWRPRIVLPADFATRYPGAQGSLVVAHERAHVLRGDVRANLVAAVLRCVHWFNPLLHVAVARFRLDQELACDAAVLAHHPHARRAYADAMLNTQLAVPGLPVGCYWQSSQSLKERILMLKKPLPGRAQRRAGLLVLVIALAAGSYGAWALQPVASNQAPAYLGNVLWGNMADVDIRIDQKTEHVGVSGGAMAQKPDGALRVYLNGVTPLQVDVGDGQGRLSFEAQATNTVSATPVVAWTLRQHGKRIDQGRIKLSEKPQDLVVGGSRHGMASTATLTFRVAKETTLLGEGPKPLNTDSAGGYVVEDAVLVGDEFKVAGSADLLLHVAPGGAVSQVDIEHVLPPNALTHEQASDYAGSMRFRPTIRDGTAIATLVRTTVHFAPDSEAVEQPPAWFKPAPSGKDARAGSTPAPARAADAAPPPSLPPPKYPADAVAKKISGKVVLLVDVAADGNVKHVEVESSQPAGVFDQAAMGAAKDWTFNPAVEGGKPVAGRIRVPITFDASAMGEVPMKLPAGRNVDPAAYDWIKYDHVVDKDIRDMTCDIANMDPQSSVAYCGRLKRIAGLP